MVVKLSSNLFIKEKSIFSNIRVNAYICVEIGIDNIFPLKMDVTKEDDLIKAASDVLKWIKNPSAKKTRVLHSVVNNAGIGAAGLIDWSPVSTYQKVIDGKN